MRYKYEIALLSLLFYLCLLAGCHNLEPSSSTTPGPIVAATAIVTATATEGARNSPNYDLRPGEALGAIHLGYSFADVLRLYPKKENVDRVSEKRKLRIGGVDYFCPKDYHWISLDQADPLGENYYFFDDNDRVFQIAARGAKHRLSDGLGVGSKWEDVVKTFPNVKEFKIEFVSERVKGNTEERYLVDRDKGVAFENYVDSGENLGKVTMVIVFEPGTDFIPRGCVTPPARYVEVR